MAVPFLVYLTVGLVQAPTDLQLEARREIDKASVIIGDFVDTKIVIENKGKPLGNLNLEDPLFPTMTILNGDTDQRVSLPAKGTTELVYRFKAARGLYTWKTIRVCASDPFGLFEIRRDLPAAGEVLVRPVPLPMRSLPIKPRFTVHASGPISARLAGSGTDFWGIREYRPGDSLRRLNWRLGARHPHHLFTNEFEREEIADFGLILDARRFSSSSHVENSLFEHAVSAAASLAENFIRSGNRVSLLVYGETISFEFPGYGRKQLNHLLRHLARARLGANLPFSYLEYFPTRLFPASSQIVIFSPVNNGDLATYARLLAYGYGVLLISPDPVDLSSQLMPASRINALASRAARVERVARLKQLMKMGVKVIDWQVNTPFETAIRRNSKHLMHTRRI